MLHESTCVDIFRLKTASLKRTSHQLVNMSRLVYRSSKQDLMKALREGDNLDIVKAIVPKWRSAADDRRSERDGARVYTAFYSYRLAYRVWSSWRLFARTESLDEELTMKIRALSAENEKQVDAIVLQSNLVVQERDSLKRELVEEKQKHQQLVVSIRTMFQSKFQDLTSDISNLVGPPSTEPIPIINYIPSREEEAAVIIVPQKTITRMCAKKSIK